MYVNLPGSKANRFDDAAPATPSQPALGKLEPDYQSSYTAWKKAQTPETRYALLKNVQPVLDTAIYSYAGGNTSNAVRSKAKLMALNAFDSYDPTRGNLKTHLLSQLRGLQRAAVDSQQIIKLPERVFSERNRLREAEESLEDSLGRPPSDAELANHTGLSLKRIAYVRKAHTGINTGSLQDETGEEYSPASTIPGSTSRSDAWRDMIYHDLSPVDQTIMDYTFGLRGTPIATNREIAQRVGLTEGAISQRKAKIQALLDEQYGQSIFGGGL